MGSWLAFTSHILIQSIQKAGGGGRMQNMSNFVEKMANGSAVLTIEPLLMCPLIFYLKGFNSAQMSYCQEAEMALVLFFQW